MLVIIAHPDDEIFVSGTLCLLAEKGFRTSLVCVTDGENGSGELFKLVEPALPLGEVRRRELSLSAWALNVRQVTFLGQVDIPPADWDSAKAWDKKKLICNLAELIQRTDAKLILTHGPLGGYGHPAHREVHCCVMAAVQEIAFSGSVYSFAGQIRHAFFSWRFDQPSNVLIDSRSFLRRRVASLCYHQTQSEFFLTPYFPRTVRAILSAFFGCVFAFTEAGRKRVPIMRPGRFYKKFPIEGLVLQWAPSEQSHFFLEKLGDDPRVRVVA